MNKIKVTPNCRYGHGDLIQVDQVGGEKKHFGLVMLTEGDLDPTPGALHGLSFWICTSCGYSELFDDDVGQTAKNMGAQ